MSKNHCKSSSLYSIRGVLTWFWSLEGHNFNWLVPSTLGWVLVILSFCPRFLRHRIGTFIRDLAILYRNESRVGGRGRWISRKTAYYLNEKEVQGSPRRKERRRVLSTISVKGA